MNTLKSSHDTDVRLSALSAFNQLDCHVKKEAFKGWDLFDGLNSKLFRATPLYRNAFLRLAWIQFFKRSPVNFRKIAGVPKGFNAKGLALFASGLVNLNRVEEAAALLDRLDQMTCEGFSGKSWGYNFDWQARAFYVPAGKPNMIACVFAANAFLDVYDKRKNREALDTAEKSAAFILRHLVLHEDDDTLCFGYIPGETARVHNVNMLGACLLARLFSITGNNDLLVKSRKAMTYSMEALNKDFSWPYGERDHHGFIDNFHTGFNLVALKNWMEYTDIFVWEDDLRNAYEYYLNNFWLEDGRPKYYNSKLYPIDIHCSAQGIITCLTLQNDHENSLERADIILKWVVENMQSPQGCFYYQKTRYYLNKIPYIRWSQAWMFYALSMYLSVTADKNSSEKEEHAAD